MASRLDRLWESPILRGKSSNQVIGRVYVAWGAAGCYKAFHLRSARSLSRAVQWWNFWVHLQKMIGKCHWVKSYNFDIIYYTVIHYLNTFACGQLKKLPTTPTDSTGSRYFWGQGKTPIVKSNWICIHMLHTQSYIHTYHIYIYIQLLYYLSYYMTAM